MKTKMFKVLVVLFTFGVVAAMAISAQQAGVKAPSEIKDVQAEEPLKMEVKTNSGGTSGGDKLGAPPKDEPPPPAPKPEEPKKEGGCCG